MRQELANLKRELILKEAGKHFDMHGYSATQVSQIAKEAEVSIGTIYDFFGSKEGLFQSYILYKIEAGTQVLQTLMSQNNSAPKENLKALMRHHFADLESKKSSVQEMLLSSPLLMGEFCQKANSQGVRPIVEFYKLIASQLELLHQNQPLIHTDFLQLAFNLKGLAFAYIERWVLLEDVVLSDQIDACLEIYFKGIIK